MILVVLAIGNGLSPFRSSRICPVSLSNRIAPFALIAGGLPLTVRMGLGFGVGVGVMGVRVDVVAEFPGVSPLNRRFPSGVKVRIGTAIMMLIDINSRVIAIVRRII
jgi:hypothetical protein